MKKACTERLERERAAEVEKRQQFLAERRETSQATSRPLAEGEDSLRDLLLKVATMTAERHEWYEQAAEAFGKLKAAEADVALKSTLWEANQKEMDTHTTEIAELQWLLTAMSAEFSQLSAKHSELTNELSRVSLQNAVGAAVLSDLKLVAGNCERPNKRAEVTRQ